MNEKKNSTSNAAGEVMRKLCSPHLPGVTLNIFWLQRQWTFFKDTW